MFSFGVFCWKRAEIKQYVNTSRGSHLSSYMLGSSWLRQLTAVSAAFLRNQSRLVAFTSQVSVRPCYKLILLILCMQTPSCAWVDSCARWIMCWVGSGMSLFGNCLLLLDYKFPKKPTWLKHITWGGKNNTVRNRCSPPLASLTFSSLQNNSLIKSASSFYFCKENATSLHGTFWFLDMNCETASCWL